MIVKKTKYVIKCEMCDITAGEFDDKFDAKSYARKHAGFYQMGDKDYCPIHAAKALADESIKMAMERASADRFEHGDPTSFQEF